MFIEVRSIFANFFFPSTSLISKTFFRLPNMVLVSIYTSSYDHCTDDPGPIKVDVPVGYPKGVKI